MQLAVFRRRVVSFPPFADVRGVGRVGGRIDGRPGGGAGGQDAADPEAGPAAQGRQGLQVYNALLSLSSSSSSIPFPASPSPALPIAPFPCGAIPSLLPRRAASCRTGSTSHRTMKRYGHERQLKFSRNGALLPFLPARAASCRSGSTSRRPTCGSSRWRAAALRLRLVSRAHTEASRRLDGCRHEL